MRGGGDAGGCPLLRQDLTDLVKEVLETIRALAAEGMTMVVVTHEVGFAREVADRVVFMDEGMIVEQASPKTFFTDPKEERSQLFLSRIL